MGLADTATCECGKSTEEQTTLCNPARWKTNVRKSGPTNAPLYTKLWGHVDDLQRTVLFVAASVLRI